MQSTTLKATMKLTIFALCILLLGAAGFAQTSVTLTAQPTSVTLPDGSTVPMWGYTCGTVNASCSSLNPNAGSSWSPVLITVPASAPSLSITLQNNLTFAAGTGTNNIPTSLVIVGQLGGGLGDVSKRTTTPSPLHDNQPTTWPIANTGGVFVPPTQGNRVQSFATEVAGGSQTTLTWSNLRPGTYLLESGTHPSIQVPMGLYGIVVVTTAPSGGTAGTAYPGVSYSADIPMVFGEIDPAQNNAVQTAVTTAGFVEYATYGPTLGGPVTSISVTHGGAGYTVPPTVNLNGGGGSGASATAVIDTDSTSPTFGQVVGINIDNAGTGYTSAPTVQLVSNDAGTGAVAVSALQLQGNPLGNCQAKGATAAACYPPVVNYTPLYYLINGVAFDKTSPAKSLFSTPGTTLSGNVLVRMVNAGSRMHVPSMVGEQTTQTDTANPNGVLKPGFSLIAEDGNALPGTARVQSEVFMAAGKTYDVMISAPTCPTAGCTALTVPVYDRELSLSANGIARDSGMLAYIGINGGQPPATAASAAGSVVPNNDTYNAVLAGKALQILDVGKGVIANDVNVFGVKLGTVPTNGTVTLNADGTFAYVPCDAATPPTCTTWPGSDSFTYIANGNAALTATVALGPAALEGATGISCGTSTFNARLASTIKVNPPGMLASCADAAGYALQVDLKTGISNVAGPGTLTVAPDSNGGFIATVTAPGTYTFQFNAVNAQGTSSAQNGTNGTGTVTLTFLSPSNLAVKVLDGADKTTQIMDYRWIIEEDRTFYVNPKNVVNGGCGNDSQGNPITDCTNVPAFGTNFHTSYMPLIATGCTGPKSCETGQTLKGQAAVCDIGDGTCRTDATQETAVDPSQVVMCDYTNHPEITNCLDPNKRYYISILPGDAAEPFIAGYGGSPTGCDMTVATAAGSQSSSPSQNCGHGMGGAPIMFPQQNAQVTILTQPSPFPPAKVSIFVFEDDYPLNGEHDAGGGIDVLSPNEPGLGGFNITLQDFAGGTGDSTGQPDYDMFNMPLSNSLAGTIDPSTGMDACPISNQATNNPTQKGITGMVVTCPKYESDGKTESPLAGQAVIANLYPGRYGIVATPAADRIARGEEWLQTNTLDGQKAHDSFLRVGEPAYFQEFGPAGYHVTIGFANPDIINQRGKAMCNNNAGCNNEVKGHISTARMSRTPDERLYGSGDNEAYGFTQCYASLGDPDGADFYFIKCDGNGNFDFKNVPPGNWKLTTFDQWNDLVVDGITTPVPLCDQPTSQLAQTPCTSYKGGTGATLDMGEIAVHQWQADIYTRTFIDTNGDGVSQDSEPGLALSATNIRFRDGSYSNFNSTDLNGYAGFNEVFPLFNWYVIETDMTRYKNTGTHVVYDAGGQVDGSSNCGQAPFPPCGSASSPYAHYANTMDQNPLPQNLHVPGAVYCATADCGNESIATGPYGSNSPMTNSTGRIDPPWVDSEGWQGFAGQNNFLEFGKKPFAPGENGGIFGHVVYASTRPFDDPQLLLQLSWEPLVPHVRINLYKEGTAADGVTTTLTLVDHTETSSFDDWAQGFRSDGIPNMNCPGQSSDGTYDPFFFGLKDQKQYLDYYKNGAAAKALPNDSQFKCYDGMHNWNQLEPAPYDGFYRFPSVTAMDTVTGKPTATNCTACVTDPDSSDPYRYGGSTTPVSWTAGNGTPMLPDGKYVVEVVVPPGYELVKEEDKNILIGDNYIAPVTQQFAGLGNVFILPDQAQIASQYNSYNGQNPTQSFGRNSGLPSHEGDTGSDESFWPCVGQTRIVPDYISLFPGSQEVAPFAGASRPLCDRKEVTLTDQTSVLTKFYIFTSTHVAAHFTGVITDDFTAEFDPFSPQFGEKFGPAYMPVSLKDWAGNEIARVYADQFGAYTGLSYSTWEVNPPNPTGYAPTMMVVCMNDSGPIPDPNNAGQMITDPLFQTGYSQFCYELPFMPGQTGYFDTPVVPTSAFAGGYNTPDCSYPNATPAIREVDGDGIGPWVAASTNGAVLNISLSGGGSGYSSAPSVTFTGGGGSGASAKAVISGSVNHVNISNAGSGYTSAPTVTFTGGGGSGATATATISLGRVTGVTITNGGTGYTSAPTVTFSAPSGFIRRLATGSSTISGPVVAIDVTSGGSGYTAAPTVGFTGGGGSGAAAAASIYSGNAQLTITALGDQQVDNYGYVGPQAQTDPFNKQKISRHYGFGGTQGTVTIGGQAATVTGWNDTTITVQVPASIPAAANTCSIAQQGYSGTPAQCGQLVITTAAGKQSIDTVTVTIGGKAPTRVSPGPGAIQAAIDKAAPGDLLMVAPGVYDEMVLMWKPLRLQGVGAASSIIDANPHPAGKLDPWRRQVVCLFGLALDGTAVTPNNQYDPSGTFSCSPDMYFSVDRLPLEATVGWDATLNGNLAEQLIEPTLMGAFEGAGITVLSKGVRFPDPSQAFAADTFPTGTTLLTSADCDDGSGHNPYPGNFWCNPSSIDGLTVRNSSQGGGGILVHGWGHNLQISNDRVTENQGTLTGGITVGQGEHPGIYVAGGGATNAAPGSCVSDARLAANLSLPYCFDLNVSVHNNMVTQNSSLGDELFSSTPAGAGGVSFCSGADYYRFNYNWVCGNMSTGDGAGVAHIGFAYNGDIEHNTILFNQSTNPTIATNGGGLLIMGAPDVDPPCGTTTDQDCVSNPGDITPSDGIGPGLIINGNLILGNSADAGSGGGLRLQHLNGTDVLNFPNASPNGGFRWPVSPTGIQVPSFQASSPWNAVQVTNNIIANNVAGWDGGGVAMLDALNVNFINNTVVSNDSTASSGVLFGALFAPLSSAPGTPGNTNCTLNGVEQSCPQVAGLVSVTNSDVLKANIALLPNLNSSGRKIACPSNHGTLDSCKDYSVPVLYNDVISQNRSFYIGVGSFGGGTTSQQKLVSLFKSFTTTQTGNQTATGSCDSSNPNYWDIGVRGDTSPTATTLALTPMYSFLSSGNYAAGANPNHNNTTTLAGLTLQYCNGSRVPPEYQKMGWEVPPGTNESNALPTPVFSLMPSATVDEGNNWVNLRWGPLSTVNPTTNVTLFDADLTANSAAKDVGTLNSGGIAAPSTDYYGNPRPSGTGIDVGAIEYQVPPTISASLTPTLWTPTQTRNCPGGTLAQRLACGLDPSQMFTLTNTGNVPLTNIGPGALAGNNVADFKINVIGTSCGTSITNLAPGGTCTVRVQFQPLTSEAAGTKSVTLSITDAAGTQSATINATAN